MLKFRQSPEITSPVKSILREPSVLQFWEKASKTGFVLLSLLSSPVTDGRNGASGRPHKQTDAWVSCLGHQIQRGESLQHLRDFFFPCTAALAALFWPRCRALCRAPADGHCSAGVCAHFIHMSGAAFLLQSCTVALGGIPNVTPELLLRADKSTGSSSAASRVPRGSQRDQHRDGNCWLGTVQIWGLPKAQFQGETTPGGDSVRNSFPRRRSGEQRAFQMWRQEAEQAGGAGDAPEPVPSHLTWQTLQAQPRADLTFPCSFYLENRKVSWILSR